MAKTTTSKSYAVDLNGNKIPIIITSDGYSFYQKDGLLQRVEQGWTIQGTNGKVYRMTGQNGVQVDAHNMANSGGNTEIIKGPVTDAIDQENKKNIVIIQGGGAGAAAGSNQNDVLDKLLEIGKINSTFGTVRQQQEEQKQAQSQASAVNLDVLIKLAILMSMIGLFKSLIPWGHNKG